MATPLQIEILMHYATRGDDFPRLDAQAVKGAVDDFLRSGMLDHADPEIRLADEPWYVATEGTRIYLAALRAVPFPERKWVISDAAPTPLRRER